MKSKKILRQKQEIKDYIGIESDELFKILINKGLPVIVIGRDYYSHIDNIDEYFRQITRRGLSKTYDKPT